MAKGWILAALALAPAVQDGADEKALRGLIEQLDAEDLSQRERARDELQKKGRAVAPVLRKFTSGASAETAAQIRSILERFEWDESLERTLPPVRTVTIPRGTHAPGKIFEEIARQTGYRVAPYSMNLRASVEAGWEGAPVLQVLDDLCRALGRGRPVPPVLARAGDDDEDNGWPDRRKPGRGDVLAIDGATPPPAAVAHWKQFRAAVTDVTVTEQRSLKETSVEASLQVVVGAQPGTQPVFVGGWEIEEAVDDKGTSLKLPQERRGGRFGEDSIPDTGEDPNAVWFSGDRWSRYEVGTEPIALQPPAAGARRLVRLKVKLRVSFAIREVSKTLEMKDFKDRATLEVGAAVIHVTKAEAKDKRFNLSYEVAGKARGAPTFILLDKDGREISTSGGGSSGGAGKMSRHWYLRGPVEVAAVRTTARIGHKTFDVPFEFVDVPLPPEE